MTKKPPKMPSLIRIGPSVLLMSKDTMVREWQISPRRLAQLVHDRLRIPSIRIGHATYFNLIALEQVLYILLKPGAADLVASGHKQSSDALRGLPDDLLARLNDSLDPIHHEMALVSLKSNAHDVKTLRVKMSALDVAARSHTVRKGSGGSFRKARASRGIRIPQEREPAA